MGYVGVVLWGNVGVVVWVMLGWRCGLCLERWWCWLCRGGGGVAGQSKATAVDKTSKTME